MSLTPRSFLLLTGFGLMAGVSAAAAVAGPQIGLSGTGASSAVVQVSSGDKADADRRRTRDVDAPYARVEAGRRVRVDAPFADVDVNSDRRRVRVQAPFADVDVRW